MAIRPVRFRSNPETAASNVFQARQPWSDDAESNRIAQRQFDSLVNVLERHHIRCIAIEDTPEPQTPDSIFPNNWVSTHADGSVVLYPMEAVSRRGERRDDILSRLTTEFGFAIRRRVDLTRFEQHDQFLEGTGSLVLDRVNRVAYACLSSRTHNRPLDVFDTELGYRSIRFESYDANGAPIYHTNVMMCVGKDFAVLCSESINAADRVVVESNLADSGRRLIGISYEQMHMFAGNMLALHDHHGDQVIAMSARAWSCLNSRQKRLLEASGSVAAADIAHIETESGGSVRCMLAEVHLPAQPVH